MVPDGRAEHHEQVEVAVLRVGLVAVRGVHLRADRLGGDDAAVDHDDLVARVLELGIVDAADGREHEIGVRVDVLEAPHVRGFLADDLRDCARFVFQQSIVGATPAKPPSGAGSQLPTITMS